MANLSQEDRAVIAKHPLADCLNHLWVPLRKAEQSWEPSPTSDNGGGETRNQEPLKAVSRLLPVLLGHEVAFTLRSKSGSGDLASELSALFRRVRSGHLNYQQYRPLILLVIKNAPDIDIWNAVFDLIRSISQTTPPTSIPSLKSVQTSIYGTPRVRSSASFRDSQQTRNIIRTPVLEELSGRTFVDVKQFYTKYFENKEWSKTADLIFEKAPNNNPLSNFPEAPQPEELEIWDWLDDFQKRYLVDAPRLYHRAKSKKDIKGALGERQLDIILKDRTASLTESHHAKDFRVIGELTKTKKSGCWKAKFTQLAIYVRDAFAAQPTRWFVHGFLMFGSQMQLWVFDRSGAYSSETFDVREEPKQFVRVVVGYAFMTKAELGLDTFIQDDVLHPTVTLPESISGKDRILQLEATPIFSQNAIACRGTSCFSTADGTLVVKFSWRPDKKRSEADYLTIARGVKGVPVLVGSRDVITIEDLRKGLEIKTPKNLGHSAHDRSTSSPQVSFTSQSTQALSKLSMSSAKRKSSFAEEATSRKRHSSSQKSNLQQEVLGNSFGSGTPGQSFTRDGSALPQRPLYRNRVLTCQAISPAGRPLQDFRSVPQVLHVFRDVITAHKSLFLDRKLLQRDVSFNNIILTDPKENRGCSGMLIDFDLGVLVGEDGKNETSEEKNMTGTLEYMAIQILEGAIRKETAGTDHTYRHDLESFFYVFLSLCIRYGWPDGKKPKTDPLKRWYTGDFDDISGRKRGDIEPGGFEIYVLKHFSPEFQAQKALARKLRTILFSKGALYVDTPQKPATLYDPIIKLFEDAIRETRW